MRRRRGLEPAEQVPLTSMMDLMTIVLVFLLSAMATEAAPPRDDLELPASSARGRPVVAVTVVLTQREILVDGEHVLALVPAVDPETGRLAWRLPPGVVEDRTIQPLHQRLLSRAVERAGAGEGSFSGELLIECDRRLPYAIVRDVMDTAGRAGFNEFRFVTHAQP